MQRLRQFREQLIYEQSAARTVREQQQKRSCGGSRQPLKIAQSSEAANPLSSKLNSAAPAPIFAPMSVTLERRRRVRAEQSVPRSRTPPRQQ